MWKFTVSLMTGKMNGKEFTSTQQMPVTYLKTFQLKNLSVAELGNINFHRAMRGGGMCARACVFLDVQTSSTKTFHFNRFLFIIYILSPTHSRLFTTIIRKCWHSVSKHDCFEFQWNKNRQLAQKKKSPHLTACVCGLFLFKILSRLPKNIL